MHNRIYYPHFKYNEVQLNKHISLKLERDRTNIYVENQLFRQCKSLMIHIPIKKLYKYDDLASIDNLEHVYPRLRYDQSDLSPEDEFWAHCSNIHAWIESDYDTRILHRSLAFPLLRELCRLGDIKAKRVFKDEIISRFVNGSHQVKLFLLEEGFLRDFDLEEREIINEGLDELYTTTYFANTYFSEDERTYLFDKYELQGYQRNIRPKEFSVCFTRKYDHLEPINDITDIKELKSLTDITRLSLLQNYITEIKGLEKLTYLRELALNINEIRDIKNIDHLRHLRDLSLPGNRISKIKGLENLTKLEFLNLSGNQITKIEGLENLTKLKVLSLWNNKIRDIEGLRTLKDLRKLDLGGNQISEIQGLENLANLRVLLLDFNRITEIKGLEKLRRLKEISFHKNIISKVEDFPELPDIQEVNLIDNPISSNDIKYIKKIFGTRINIFFT